MECLPRVRVIDDFLTINEIDKLTKWFSFMPEEAYSLGSQKNLHYHKPTLVRSIIKPKIDGLIGDDYTVGAGSYKADTIPHPHHVDNYRHFGEVLGEYSYTPKHNLTLLIPLNESPHFKTIFWDVFVDGYFKSNGFIEDAWKTSTQTALTAEQITHISEPMRSDLLSVPIDQIVDWKLGSAIISHRYQLHASTDFAKHSLTKKFAVFFID